MVDPGFLYDLAKDIAAIKGLFDQARFLSAPVFVWLIVNARQDGRNDKEIKKLADELSAEVEDLTEELKVIELRGDVPDVERQLRDLQRWVFHARASKGKKAQVPLHCYISNCSVLLKVFCKNARLLRRRTSAFGALRRDFGSSRMLSRLRNTSTG